MFLKHLSEFSEGKQNKRKCVLSVPHFFTKAQRETLFGAAEIAGLEPVAIANELTCGMSSIDNTFISPKSLHFMRLLVYQDIYFLLHQLCLSLFLTTNFHMNL